MQDFIPKKIDINGNIGTVTVKQFDNDSRFLHVTIIDGDLSDGDSNAFIMQDCSAALYMQPEGDGDPARVSYINGEIADPETGVVTFLIPGSVTRTPGRYECEIFIYQGNESERPVISTKPFSLVVEKSIRNDAAVMASQSMSALDAKIQQVNALQSQVNTLISLAESGDITPGSAEAEVISARTGWNGAVYATLGDAIRIQVDQAAQYRAGINAQYATYHSHVYEYTKEGTFYATQYDTSGSAIVRRWVDLPDQTADFIIRNTRYGDNWVLQTAIQGSSPDIVYQRVVPRSEASGTYAWRRISCDLSGVQSQIDSINSAVANLPQCREGINAQSATYNRHAYEYKKDGTFYVTPANWDDLPADNANYIVTNSRYGSWIMQTAVKSSDPAMVYRRFVSNNPADDQNPATFYTIAANGYGWELCDGTDIAKFGTAAASDYLTVGLPILYLAGDLSNMKKKIEGTDEDDIRTADFQYEISLNNWVTGQCTVKLQGSSSIVYTKKNYTITFGSAMDVGWGNKKKYCFKANYVDNSNALNVCGARLWSEIVADRNSHPAIAHNAPNNGAMDGFPCIIILNGKFHGLYTWNIPKDKWAFGMGDSANEYIVTAEQHSDPTKFRTTTDFATDENGKALDFKIEYKPDAASIYDVKASINLMLDMVSTFDSRMWNYIDFETAMDYMIFSALIANTDGVDKNFILTSYDGVKWWLNAYDLDSIMGNFWTGGSYYAPDDSDARNKTSFLWLAGTSRLFNVLWNNHRSDVIARYNALRAGILSEEHIYMTLYNFCARIPQVIIDEDNRKYPLKPGTSTETLSRIMEWYRQRCAFIDAEIADTQESVDAELQAFKNYLGV